MQVQGVTAGGRAGLPARRVTIKDVAKLAGVSVTAASKVLNNTSYGVSDELRNKVEDAIEVLHYRPLASARGMRGKTYSVGVLVSDIKNPFFGFLIDGIEKEVEVSGYDLFIVPAGATVASQGRRINRMLDHQMDGLILIAPVGPEGDLARIAAKVPTIVVGRHGPAQHYDTVAGDDIAGSKLIVDHLIGLGHTRIAHITHAGNPQVDSRAPESVRARGYEEAMRRHGLGENIDIIATTWSDEGGHRAAEELLAREELPTAIHAGADVAAFGLLGALWETQYRVPEDISVVGYDNTPEAAHAPVALTSVDQSGIAMGADAANLLLERIKGRAEAVHHLVTPTLVVRRTTTVPRSLARPLA